MEIEFKEAGQFKLTVTRDKSRIAIKVPPSYEGADKDEIIEFLKSAAEQINYPHNTLRGTFNVKRQALDMKVSARFVKYKFNKKGAVAEKVFDIHEKADF
jgi:hypothetical protein